MSPRDTGGSHEVAEAEKIEGMGLPKRKPIREAGARAPKEFSVKRGLSQKGSRNPQGGGGKFRGNAPGKERKERQPEKQNGKGRGVLERE